MNNKLYLIASALIGFLFFAICGGLNTLNVTDISFLMSGDPAQHWLGWEFFRHTPLLQWPIGKNINYGIELNNSIVYTDSIPIFAVFFKLFSFALPDKFQYTGIWLALCFMLQGVTSFLLVNKITKNNFYSLLASIIFITATPFIHRTGGHFALSAHWLIIASVCLYFNEKYSSRKWVLLLVLASWVHAYILAMMLVVWMADLCTRYKKNEFTIDKFLYLIVTVGIYILVAMYVIGYFSISNSFSAGGFGYYKLNLNSFVNPFYEPYSSIIKPLPAGKGDYEGINYLGFGVLLMIAITFCSAKIQKIKLHTLIKSHYILFAFAVLTTLYALSSNITLGENTIIAFYIPKVLEGITNSFRASGRFAWVAYYLISVAVIVGTYKIFNKRNATIILFACTFINVYDVHHIFKERRNSYSKITTDYLIKSPNWDYVKKEYTKLLAVSPWDFSEESIKWAYYASTNNMSMNFGYFARFNGDAWEKQTKEINDAVNSGKLDDKAVYLFKDKSHYESVLHKLGSSAFSFEDNGVYVIGLKK
ncbi:DUF6311 domain-containing protein [Serratia proteamaculans]|uniref:DUF6311 domain-containing protein n=1 Tax=Serratia proteamaculans TaxID=28151 RepID=UPI0039AF8E1E